jgi:hypothetical protein
VTIYATVGGAIFLFVLNVGVVAMATGSEMTLCPHCGETVETVSVICRFCYSGISENFFHPCSCCAEVIRKDAVACRFCKTEFPPPVVPELTPEQEELEAAEFRKTFLGEIGNLITYNLEMGEALSLIVSIIGRGLQVSRCLIYCTNDGLKWCYSEYSHCDVGNCTSLDWKASKSLLVAQAVRAKEPIFVFADKTESNTELKPSELSTLTVQSALAVALPRSEHTQGCLILQQCDYKREWLAADVEWILKVAKSLSESLVVMEKADKDQAS